MKRNELLRKTDEVINETKSALQTIYDALNHGQQQKLLKDDSVRKLFEKYNIIV